MTLLALDVGSSSVKAAVMREKRVVGQIVRAGYPTRHAGVRVEVAPNVLLKAIRDAIAQLGAAAKRIDVIGLSVMSPAWLAMDAKGKPLTPIITHQDRRSVEVAKALEQRVGKERYLSIGGNRPVPVGISV